MFTFRSKYISMEFMQYLISPQRRVGSILNAVKPIWSEIPVTDFISGRTGFFFQDFPLTAGIIYKHGPVHNESTEKTDLGNHLS